MGKDFPYYCLWRLLDPELFSTETGFNLFPRDSRNRYFIRRVKEEMVDLRGKPIYPLRICDTVSYELSQGAASEQELYDEATTYIRHLQPGPPVEPPGRALRHDGFPAPPRQQHLGLAVLLPQPHKEARCTD
jgi:hypothetical protein